MYLFSLTSTYTLGGVNVKFAQGDGTVQVRIERPPSEPAGKPGGSPTFVPTFRPSAACKPLKAPLRIMNVGDSITLGVVLGMSDYRDGGYRLALQKSMKDAEANVEFVGPFESPKGYWHAGYNAATIDGMARNIYRDVFDNKPNVVTLQAGTNDFFFYEEGRSENERGGDAEAALARLRIFVDNAFRAAADASIEPFHLAISSTTDIDPKLCATYNEAPWNPPNCPSSMQKNIASYALLIPHFVREVNAAKGYTALSFHDVNRAVNEGRGFISSDYAKWGIHFSNPKEGRGGYDKIGEAWAKHLLSLHLVQCSVLSPAKVCSDFRTMQICKKNKCRWKKKKCSSIPKRQPTAWPTRRPTKSTTLFACDNFKQKFACKVKSKKRCVWISNACTLKTRKPTPSRTHRSCESDVSKLCSLMNRAICRKAKGVCA